jgi:archaeal type IV pilus assembly protein PilA
MNVLGARERSWRKAHKRAVSPIIATILLVAITVVLAAVLYVLISGLTHGPGSTPIGSAFAAGNPHTGTCSAAGSGCTAVNDFIETLTIEQSTVTFGSVLFEVTTSAGLAWGCGSTGTGTGAGTACAFSVITSTGTVVASSAFVAGAGMVMSGGFTTYGGGVTSGSALSTGIYQIVIDMSGKGSTGLGLSLVVIGQGSYSGTTAPVALF